MERIEKTEEKASIGNMKKQNSSNELTDLAEEKIKQVQSEAEKRMTQRMKEMQENMKE